MEDSLTIPIQSGKTFRRFLRLVGWLTIVAALAIVVSNITLRSDFARPSGENLGSATVEDATSGIAARYAPFIYHATARSGGRQDVISNLDFDGDLIGGNNWENFGRYRLKPTVYYAVLETGTHYFIAYHLFHPRDWNHFTFWLNDTHENDGENLQVVARKSDGRVVLLLTQAHYKTRLYARPGSEIEAGRTSLTGLFQTMNDDGAPSEEGRHPAVFVESEGHGIYGTLDSDSQVSVDSDGSPTFEHQSGLLFRPSRTAEQIIEPEQTTSGECPYQLDSTIAKLWPLLLEGQLTGNGRLLEGSYPYQDDLVNIREVPRYYDGNRFSGPLGNDRGISPFALDFSFDRGTLGALFFNPARRYFERLKISGPWSTDYVDYPFIDQSTRANRPGDLASHRRQG